MSAAEQDQEELKRKLLRRVGIAGVLIALLLGALALLEDMLADKPAPPAEMAAAAPAAAESVAKDATAGEAVKEETPPEQKPDEAQAQGPEAPAQKEQEAPRAEPEKTETPLAPAPEPKAAQRVTITAPVPAPEPKASVAAKGAPPAAAANAAPVGDIGRSFRVQMGVFTSAAHAEDLHARLEKSGIPSYIETRVQVGPFKTQKEAEAARRQLKALGLGPGLLIPPQKR
ncbi:MAG TPA: SPOR domain-containing protein [Candidatus Desulfobacillus sp.]|nr:SPOR domain-containing protein [Candidatus Desulfobacillus sp.]